MCFGEMSFFVIQIKLCYVSYPIIHQTSLENTRRYLGVFASSQNRRIVWYADK